MQSSYSPQPLAPESEEKPNVVELEMAADQQDSNRSSKSKTISLVNCLCSCHDESKNDGIVRYALVEEESEHKIEDSMMKSDTAMLDHFLMMKSDVGNNQQAAAEKWSSNQFDAIPSFISDQLTDESSEQAAEDSSPSESNFPLTPTRTASNFPLTSDVISEYLSAATLASEMLNDEPFVKESNTSGRSKDLCLDKLSESKFCSNCGKLKTSWLFDEKKPTFEEEKFSKNSDEVLNETEIAKEDLSSIRTQKSGETLKSVSMKTQTSIGSGVSELLQQDAADAANDINDPLMTARAGTSLNESHAERIYCNQECKMHCPQIREYNPPVQEKYATASDNLTKNESAPVLLEKPLMKSVSIVESESDKRKKEDERKKRDEENKKNELKKKKIEEENKKKEDERKFKECEKRRKSQEKQKLIPPKVILSLVDVDIEGKRKSLLQEKSTQSPSPAQKPLEKNAEESKVPPATAEDSTELHFWEDMQDSPANEPSPSKEPFVKRLSDSYEYYAKK